VTPAARLAWPRRWPGVMAWTLWALAMLACLVVPWLDELLRRAGRPDLVQWDLRPGVALVSAATVGAVLAGQRPRHPVGWLLLAVGLSMTVDALATGYVRYGLLARPGALPAADYLAGFSSGVVIVWVSCAGFILLLTPTGSLPSPRWRWWARVAAAAAAAFQLGSVFDPAPLEPEHPAIGNPLAIQALASPVAGATGAICGVIVLAALFVAAWSLVLRFRRARGLERLQLRWLALAAVLAAMLLLVTTVAVGVSNDGLVLASTSSCVALLPLATGAAILRYRLYDLDRIISRTVAYALLTLLLGLGYAAVVIGLGRLLPQGSSLVVAAATLAVAAVFQPARRRVQGAVDRRFNRRRYDAARTIQAFSARLRQEVDLDALTGELLAVVQETMQPTRASLWLRPPRA
jgi:hypothetical protein